MLLHLRAPLASSSVLRRTRCNSLEWIPRASELVLSFSLWIRIVELPCRGARCGILHARTCGGRHQFTASLTAFGGAVSLWKADRWALIPQLPF